MTTLKNLKNLRPTGFVLAAIIHPLLVPLWCQAGLLSFELNPNGPVVLSIDGTLTYDHASGNFQSLSDPITYSSNSVPGGFAFFSSGELLVDLFVDSNGSFVASGTGLRLTGAIDFDSDGTDDVSGDTTNPLLFGPITAFGADPPGPPTLAFNGIFDIQGGQLTGQIPLSGGGSLFGGFPTGALGGFILFAENVTSGTLGDFSQDFASDGVKGNVGVIVPEPSTLVLLIGAAGMFGLGRRKLARCLWDSDRFRVPTTSK